MIDNKVFIYVLFLRSLAKSCRMDLQGNFNKKIHLKSIFTFAFRSTGFNVNEIIKH